MTRLETLLERLDSGLVVSALESRVNLTRSSRYGRRRHAARHRAAYESALRREPAARSAASLARRGRALSLLGRAAEAAVLLRRAAALDSRSSQAWAWLWDCGGGRAALDRAVSLEPGNALWRAWRGVALLPAEDRPGRARAAAEEFERAAGLDPGLALAHAGWALALGRAGRRREALESAGAAVRLEPVQAWTLHLRARLRLADGDRGGFLADAEAAILLDEGLGYLTHALPVRGGHDPRALEAAATRALSRRREAWLYVLRGDARRSPEVGDFRAALADFEKAVELGPDRSWAWAYLARARLTNDSVPAALAAVETAVSLAPSCGWIRVWRGEIRRRLGELGPALEDFEAGLARDPDYEFGYAWRGGARRALGRAREALADLDVAREMDPAYAWTLHERSLALRDLGRPGEALDELEAARSLDPKYAWCERPERRPRALAELRRVLRDGGRRALALSWKGQLELEAGGTSAALRDLRRAAALEPRLARARAWLGRALDAAGKRREALAQLDAAIRLDPRWAEPRAWRGLLRRHAGDARGALADLAAAAELDPKAAWILSLKGEAELELGRFGAAKRDLERVMGMDRGSRRAAVLRSRALKALRGR